MLPQSGALPGGQSTQLGERYQLQDITRQMAGVYQCVADNGRGQIAVGRISLQVQCESAPNARPLELFQTWSHGLSCILVMPLVRQKYTCTAQVRLCVVQFTTYFYMFLPVHST